MLKRVKPVISLLLLLPLFFSLLNSPFFGNVSLVSWFLYMFFSAIVSGIIFLLLLFIFKTVVRIPQYITAFLVFSTYVLLHGIITESTNFVHYYWAASALMLLSLFLLINSDALYYSRILYRGITILSLLETFVIFLQCTSILPVRDEAFLCTGTWVNPNVTAMFLSLGLFGVLQVVSIMRKRWLEALIVSSIVIAIMLLYCRSAYLVTFFFLLSHYRMQLSAFFKQTIRFNIKSMAFAVLLIILAFVFLSPFITKKESMTGRITIWQNSLRLIAGHPVTGHEFGRFERDYNLLSASLDNADNNHISMAYNDFLELAVEGGIIALSAWIFFLFFFGQFCLRQRRSLLPVFGMVIIQLTNFGFQAIPVMALFIIYAAAGNKELSTIAIPKHKNNGAAQWRLQHSKLLYGALLCVSLYFLVTIGKIVTAYYDQKAAHDNLKNPYSILTLKKLEHTLKFSNGFYENYGDAFMYRRQYALAIVQYKNALKTCSRPNVFAKCGFSYMQLKKFDSSGYYYRMVEKIEPAKLIPRMAMLKLYEAKKDTNLILLKAKEIIALPMPVVTKRGVEIKEYAQYSIQKIDSMRTQPNNQKFKQTNKI